MPKNIHIIAYQPLDKSAFEKHIKVSNTHPSFFSREGVRKRFSLVYAPNFKHIEDAYEKEGIHAYRPDADIDSLVQSAEDVKRKAKEAMAQMEAEEGLVIDAVNENGDKVEEPKKSKPKPINEILQEVTEEVQQKSVEQQEDQFKSGYDLEIPDEPTEIRYDSLSWPKAKSLANRFEKAMNKEEVNTVLEREYHNGNIPEYIEIDNIDQYGPKE